MSQYRMYPQSESDQNFSYEDSGRHNAPERILGHTCLNDVNTSDKAVILSGRIALVMLTKVARTGVAVVVSRVARTCLSIDLTEQQGGLRFLALPGVTA